LVAPTKNRSIFKEAKSGQVPSFPFLDSFINENEIQMSPELVANIKVHCENLITDFKKHFPFWIRKPFCVEDIPLQYLTTKIKLNWQSFPAIEISKKHSR